MNNYFYYLPEELIIIIMNFMRVQDKEHFTNTYTEYYRLFRDEKRKFLEENYQVNYRPLVKKGIDFYVERNTLCIQSMMRKKRSYINCFPEPFRRFFVDYNTPIIPYKCKFRSKSSEIFHCDPQDLKYNISIGKYPVKSDSVSKKFIFIKTKENKVISIWERENCLDWDCYFDEIIYCIVQRYYINFSLIEKIIETI